MPDCGGCALLGVKQSTSGGFAAVLHTRSGQQRQPAARAETGLLTEISCVINPVKTRSCLIAH